MARSADFWQSLYDAFDPTEVLAGERADALYCDREDDPLVEMRQELKPAGGRRRPPIVYLAGHRGSGKSSLLMRLIEESQADCFVVYFDIEHNLDSTKANQVDLLYLLGAAVYKAAEQEGLKPRPANLEELVNSVHAVTHTLTEKPRTESVNVAELLRGLLVFSAGVLGSKVGEKLAEAALQPFTITSGVSEEFARKREIEPQVQDIVGNVNLILADVQTKADRPLLVVVDGLDKIQRLEQAKLLFLDSRALRGPVCRIVYTVPMLVQTMPEFRQATEGSKVALLPNIKLYDRLDERKLHQSGFDLMADVASRRLGAASLLLSELMDRDVLDRIALHSGGMMRMFVGLVKDACMAAERMDLDRVTMAAATQAIGNLTADMTAALTIERRDELRQVRKNRMPSSSDESARLLHGLYIVAYRNGATWYDAHPLLWNEL